MVAMRCPWSSKTGVPINVLPRQLFCTLSSEPLATVTAGAAPSPTPVGGCAAAEVISRAVSPIAAPIERFRFISSLYYPARGPRDHRTQPIAFQGQRLAFFGEIED